ncbi:(2Fe-2S)-binding protein [Gibbsiella quercinecans]|uniref:(2Fe-2S)-binding protein n=1 Tax=Gibbsiella quercinecans TaxID=929813 RepID=UPI000EF1508A|nr:(2Fe-2S)-binding protein [Gibbsiella quercinecans]RLM10819.1 (2Fe-2S)-binding protein [Gibbsiella quercinecans]
MPNSTPKVVGFSFEGKPYSALQGQSIAAALFSQGVRTLRFSPQQRQPRGMFCMMGSCQECLVMVNGSRVLACKTEAKAGLTISQVPDVNRHE